MEKERTYDISEICSLLGTTSRTLRFYESKGLIQSTKSGTSSRRKYTEQQLEIIKNVMVLRSLGLPISSILALEKQNADLKNTFYSRRAEIYASIDSKIREVNLLNEVLYSMDSGSTSLSETVEKAHSENGDETEIIRICTDAILTGKTDILYGYMSERLKQYLPQSAYEKIREDTLLPLGSFVSIEKSFIDQEYPHRFIQHVCFSKIGLKITFVIYNDHIEGLWLGYYDTRRKERINK